MAAIAMNTDMQNKRNETRAGAADYFGHGHSDSGLVRTWSVPGRQILTLPPGRDWIGAN